MCARLAESGDPRHALLTHDIMVDEVFAAGGLNHLRRVVAAHASQAHTTRVEVERLVHIASELVVNAIEHGGGSGRLRLWHDQRFLSVQVTDKGPGMADPERAGRVNPSPAMRGRGLWAVRSLADHVVVSSGSTGTCVTAALALADRGSKRPGTPTGRNV